MFLDGPKAENSSRQYKTSPPGSPYRPGYFRVTGLQIDPVYRETRYLINKCEHEDLNHWQPSTNDPYHIVPTNRIDSRASGAAQCPHDDRGFAGDGGSIRLVEFHHVDKGSILDFRLRFRYHGSRVHYRAVSSTVVANACPYPLNPRTG